jgi:serine/threonine protein kinase
VTQDRCWRCQADILPGQPFCTCTDKGVPTPLVIERYNVAGYLGSGAHGTVYACVDGDTGERVAVKKLDRMVYQATDDMRELEVTRRLDHPNIVKVHDLLAGSGAIVMELVHGNNLRTLMNDKPQWVRENFFNLFVPLVDALRAAHAGKIIHRDIKPENILVSLDGTPKLTDFGVCKILESAEYTDGFAGSPAYMAPEVLEGVEYNFEADIHGLGCVMYEIWAERLPWISIGHFASYLGIKSQEIPEVLVTASKAPVSDLMSDLVARMISARPERRIRRIDLVAQLLSLDDPIADNETATLDRMASVLAGIYGYANDRHGPLYLLCQLLVSTRLLAQELLRTEQGARSDELENTFPKTFAWLCAVVSSVNVSLSQLIWLKFDGRCPYCDNSVCSCSEDWTSGKVRRNSVLLNRLRDRHLGQAPKGMSFEECRAMFDRLFGESNRKQGLNATLLHMYSELGEAMDAVLHLLPEDEETSLLALHLEISDLIAWFYATLNMYNHRHHDYDFLESFSRTFASGCYACNCNPCECEAPVGAHDWQSLLQHKASS